QETTVSQRLVQPFAEADQRPSQAHADGAALTGHAPAVDADQHIDLVGVFGSIERAEDRSTILFVEEVLVDRLTIDSDLSTAGTNAYASDARLAAPGTQRVAVDLVFLCCNHQNLPGEIAT